MEGGFFKEDESYILIGDADFVASFMWKEQRKINTGDVNHTKSVTKEGQNQQFYHQNAIHNQEKGNCFAVWFHAW